MEANPKLGGARHTQQFDCGFLAGAFLSPFCPRNPTTLDSGSGPGSPPKAWYPWRSRGDTRRALRRQSLRICGPVGAAADGCDMFKLVTLTKWAMMKWDVACNKSVLES